MVTETELEELRERLERERAEVKVKLDRLREYLKCEVDIDVDEGDFNLYEREKNLALAQSLEHKLASIDHALHLMDQGRYGICEECGKPIAIERLRAIPDTTLCLSCRIKREREARREQMA